MPIKASATSCTDEPGLREAHAGETVDQRLREQIFYVMRVRQWTIVYVSKSAHAGVTVPVVPVP